MKKFLFTLAALLSLGFAAQASNTIDFPDEYKNYEVPQALLGTDIQVNMVANFETTCNAWRVMVNVEELPEGLTLKSFSRRPGSYIDFINGDGEEDQFKPSLTSSAQTGVCLGMCMEQDINGDILMWQGNLADFVRVTFTVGADFKGGEIKWAVECSGGTTPAGHHEDLSTTWTVEAGQVDPTPAPAPVIGYNDAGQVVATCDGPNTVQLYLNGAAVDQPYTLPAATWETQTLTFTAVTQPGENETATESVEPFVVTIDPLQPTPAPAPTIVVENGFVTAVCDGPNTVQLYLNGAAVDQPFPLPAATEVEQVLTFTATTLPGEHEVATSTTEPTVVTIPAVVVPPTPTNTCERPNCAYSITALETVTVTITNNEPEATVFYSVEDADGNIVDSGSFTGEQYAFTVSGAGSYTVHCYAHIDDPDWADSADGGCFFTINENEEPPTAINELVNGKTVAGVRYFNMAGQEMSEANGMTIVVTTYTDGTTSAVKVMK